MKNVKEPGKELVKELHEMADKPLKDKIHELWVFIKKLHWTLFAVSLGGWGVVAIVYAVTQVPDMTRIGIIVSGSCAVVNSLSVAYWALMKVGN